jgi:hypothetical protein
MSSTYTNRLCHIIFSTKERRPFISAKMRDELHPYLGGIVLDEGGEPLEIGGVCGLNDRGREDRLDSAPPPSKPDRRISRIRLSSQWSYLRED